MRSILVMALLMAPVMCLAEPVITPNGMSGNVVHDSTLTILGTSFGTKDTAAPVRWDTWEAETPGGIVGSESDWWGSNVNATIDVADPDSTRHGNVDQQVKLQVPPNSVGGGAQFYKDFPGPDVYFISWWMKFDWPWYNYDGLNNQFKIAYFYALGTPGDLYNRHPQLQCVAVNHLDTPTPKMLWRSKEASSTSCPNGTVVTDVEYRLPPSTADPAWIQMSVVIDQTDINATRIVTWQTAWGGGPLNYEDHVDDLYNNVPCPDTPERIRQIQIGGSAQSGNGGAVHFISEVYVDTTMARVELGDNAVYANCTHREMQIPSAWTPEAITISVNQGSFGDTDTVYLFVIDPGGNPSDGREITFGQTVGAPGPGIVRSAGLR